MSFAIPYFIPWNLRKSAADAVIGVNAIKIAIHIDATRTKYFCLILNSPLLLCYYV